MKILFDQGTPAPLRRHLKGHEVSTAYEMEWAELRNGEFLAAAEESFDTLVTTDKNLRYQQNVKGKKLAILVLPTTSWPTIQRHMSMVVEAVSSLKPGDFVEIAFPVEGTDGRA